MICSKCGAQIRDGVQFCPNCGAKQGAQAAGAAPAGQAPQQPTQQVQTYKEQAQAYGTAGQKVGDTKNMAIAGMVCGIAGLIFDFISIPIGIILGIAAVIISGLVMSRNKGGNNGMAIAGLVCGIVALVLGIPLCLCGIAICTAGVAGSLGGL